MRPLLLASLALLIACTGTQSADGQAAVSQLPAAPVPATAPPAVPTLPAVPLPIRLNPRAAADYSAARLGDAVLVMERGRVSFQEGQNGFGIQQAHLLASGTKSFSCALLLSAASDGLLTLDESVAATLPEWRADPRKSQITLRALLSLSSGLEGGTPGEVPTYAQAAAAPTFADPWAAFDYGPNPYQVFGEVMRRKLAGDPLEYLKRRVLGPIGLNVAHWTYGPDDHPRLPSGAYLSAAEWAKYGQLLVQGGVWQGENVLDAGLLSNCFRPSPANPGYGLTFWLTPQVDLKGVSPEGAGGTVNTPARSRAGRAQPAAQTATQATAQAGPFPRIYMAAGAANQRLYLLPDQQVVVVRFGRQDRGYSDTEFLAKLLGQ